MATRKPATALGLAALLLVGLPSVVSAGGQLESFKVTADPSPIPGHLIAQVIGIKWDSRCIPIGYSVNDTQDPIPNPIEPAFLTVADASDAMQDAMDSWNKIRTSFIEMNVTGTTSNPGTRGFDFVNELTFRTPPGAGFIASSPSVSLIQDVDLLDGTDIDGDGDSDVSNTISTCADVDNDGDVEFPEGFYEAGTILENDVQFNSAVLRFTTEKSAIDAVTNSVDLEAVALHELGHSHGLSHLLMNQKSIFDGNSATMFPFIDTGDPDAELATRSLDSDEVAFASFFYPEGSASSGPGKRQHGDLDFDWIYGVIEGEVTHGVFGGPVAGASVSASLPGLDVVGSSAFSGTTQLSFNPLNGGLFLVSPDFNIVDGKYQIPVALGLYEVGVEALDGSPAAAGSISLTGQIGSIFGQQNFNEELYNGKREAALEKDAGESTKLVVLPGRTKSGIDITTNANQVVGSFGNQNFVGFTGVPGKSVYAVAVPAADIAAADSGGGITIQAGLFRTAVGDASVAARWTRASLAECTVDGATLDIGRTLQKDNIFVTQDADFTPFYFRRPDRLGRDVLEDIADGKVSHLCLTLQGPREPFAGPSGLPPFIGLDGVPGGANDVPIAGLSFLSTDEGATFTQDTTFNYMFGLLISDLP